MTAGRYKCRVAGCTGKRLRWQDFCADCYGRLSRHCDLRTGIVEARRTRNAARLRELTRRAGELLGHIAARAPIMPSEPQREPWWQRL